MVNTRRSGKREREKTQDNPKNKAPRSSRKVKKKEEAPEAPPATQITNSNAVLTRRATRALGKEITAPQEDPERYLQKQARERTREAKDAATEEMQRRGSDRQQVDSDEDEMGGRANGLQGLLRRLGAGFEDAFPGMMGGSGRIKQILAMLREEGDEGQYLTALSELCEYLAVATEDTMISFPIDQAVPLLVKFLTMDHNPDIMLLAARALTNLADVFPPACTYIIRHNAVPAFCGHLMSIEYIDLAEQSLQALEKLSHEHPGSLLRNGALVAVLSYVDFFQTGVQRVAVATAANICRGLTAEHVDAVSTAAPILINLLRYSDAKIVDSACLALTRIAEAFSRSPDRMEMLVGFGLINSIVELVAVNEQGSITSQLSANTFYGLIKLLATCASGSHVVAESLLQAGVSGTLKNLLVTSPLLSATSASPGNALRSGEQLQDLVTLGVHLLPTVPDASQALLSPPVPIPSELVKPKEEDGSEGPRMSTTEQQAAAFAAFLRENPAAADQVATDLIEVILKVHSSSGTSMTKKKARNLIIKLLYHTSAPTLGALLWDLPISSLVARLLRSDDATVAAEGMQMAEILMEKLPDHYSKFFLKEGVVHAMEELAETASPSLVTVQPTTAPRSTGRAGGSTGGVRTRRSTGRGNHEEPKVEIKQEEEEEEEDEPRQPIVERTPAGTTLRNALATHAKRFCARYFTDKDGNSIGCRTAGVLALEQICSRLPDPAAIQELLTALSTVGESSISTFELLSSGATHTLRSYLQGEDLAQNVDAETRSWQLLERLDQFASIVLPSGSGGAPPGVVLVEKLQAALAATEKFEVQMTDVTALPSAYSFFGGGGYFGGRNPRSGAADGSSSLSAGLSALSNPFKIRLSRYEGETSIKDYSTNVVLIEPLASMNQVEEFLWQRVVMSASERERQEREREQQAGGSGDARNEINNAGGGGAGPELPSRRTAHRSGDDPEQPPAGNRREASRSRPIPAAAGGNGGGGNGRRLTRAQARAAAEAEVAAQGHDEDEESESDDDAMSEDLEEDLQPGRGDQLAADTPGAGHIFEHDSEIESEYDDDDDDIDMEDGYVENDEGFDDEDDMLDAAAMHVHDMRLGEEEEAAGATGRPRPTSPGDSSEQSPTAADAEAALGAAPPHPAGGDRNNANAGNNTANNQPPAAGTAGRSYASAAANANNPAAAPTPHLAFYLNGKLLEPGTTIFQAVRAAIAAAAASSTSVAPVRSLSSRLWGDVHTLTYRPYETAIRERDEAAAPMDIETTTAQNQSSTATGALASYQLSLLNSPLAEVLSPPLLFADTSSASEENEIGLPVPSTECLDVLTVLSILEATNRLAAHIHAALQARKGQVVSISTPPPGHIPREVFINGRLGPKLSQQLKDVISICGGSLPPWCTGLARHSRFVFPFDVRRRLFYCTAFGLPRALFYLQQANAAESGGNAAADRDAGSLRISRIQRQKVRLSRDRVLESAHRVFELYAGGKSQLEVEFAGEVGSGLGPTLEFYTLLSHELQRKKLHLWRDDASGDNRAAEEKEKANVMAEGVPAGISRTKSGPGPLRGELIDAELQNAALSGSQHPTTDIVSAPFGLFPRSLPPGHRHRAENSSVNRNFRLMGRVVAKALQDCRLLDLPLSPVFYRLILGRKVDLFTLRAVDPALSTSLERLHAAECAASRTNQPVIVDGCPIEDLCLTFVLPGSPKYELCPGGSDVAVTTENLRQYIDAVVDAVLGSGVSTQVEAFRTGFNAIFPLSSLEPFFEDEIEAMLCGTGEAWTPEGLAAVIKFDHGYNAASAPIVALLEVLSELDAVDQRRFLRFVTGTPRLPPGGVAALQPKLTVVRKLSTAIGPNGEILGSSAPTGESLGVSGSFNFSGAASGGAMRNPVDGDLPSVMTCANYLKLPPYSSKDVLRERLLFAIREGQGSFDLS